MVESSSCPSLISWNRQVRHEGGSAQLRAPHAGSHDVIDNSQPSRRSSRTVLLLAAVGVLAVVALGMLLARNHQDQAKPLAVAPLPPASPGVVSASYLGSHWRLTAVTDRRGTTAIPASINAWLELAADGELLASDDVNVVNGHFTTTSNGLEVSDAISTAVGYAGNDPVQLAAITAIDALTSGPPVVSSAASSGSEAQPVHVTVLSADREHLNVQASGVRLTFVRSGPADKVNASPLPLISSAPGS